MISCPACGAPRDVPCHGRQAFDFICTKRLTAQPPADPPALTRVLATVDLQMTQAGVDEALAV